MKTLFSQPSSWAGAGIVGAILNTVATSGIPTSVAGWVTLVAAAAGAVASILLHEGKPPAAS